LTTQGVELAIQDSDSPSAFLPIGKAENATFFDGTGKEIDITTMDSVAVETQKGLKDEGSASLDVIFDPEDAGQAECLVSCGQTGGVAKRVFRLTLTDTPPTVKYFDGFVTTFPWAAAKDDVIRTTITIRITGPRRDTEAAA
jgi:hypothetical protein